VRNFEFLEPRSAGDASRMLADHGETARVLAGGTALLLAMRQRLVAPSHLVSLGGVTGLDAIAYDDRNGLRVGALVSIDDLANHPVVEAKYPVLAGMARHVANPQIRNMATIGGNLCHGDPASDPPACLLALGARAIAVRGSSTREIALEEFFTDYYETALAPDEVLTEIQVPPPATDMGAAYTRFMKTPAEHRPLLGVAIAARRANGGTVCREARIVVGASTPVPTRLHRAEAFLAGKTVTGEVLEEAGRLAAEEVAPLSDFRGSEEYRREIVRVVVRRTAAAVFGLKAPE